MSYEPCPKGRKFNRQVAELDAANRVVLELVDMERKTGKPTSNDLQDRMIEEKVRSQWSAYEKELLDSRMDTIPLRYRNNTFADYVCHDDRDREIVKHMASGKSGILHGSNGTGKTMLAFCAIRKQWEAGRYAQYILAADYFDLIRSSFNGGDPLKVLREFTDYDYLVVDEIDKKHGTQTEFVYLYRLINDRYNEMKPTVLISNSNRKDLEAVIGISAFSRVAGEGKIIEFTGEDYRKKRG
jgi:DNA replication protein DnaC